jgi:predicted  nucleic acid-binding Zn-ribbon protein
MDLMNQIINSLQDLEKHLDELLCEKKKLKDDIQSLKTENEDLKKRMQVIHSEMEVYIQELKKIRAHYVSSNNHA